jgi:xyloglucan:xyloglucosyl transferase
VDSFPIRVFRNYTGLPFPTQRPMYAYSSIWNADDWATQGGRVKADWTKAPFVAEYRNLDLQTCECADGASEKTCADACAASEHGAPRCELTDKEKRQMRSLQLGYTIYNYCDKARSEVAKDPGTAKPVPPECDLDKARDQEQY